MSSAPEVKWPVVGETYTDDRERLSRSKTSTYLEPTGVGRRFTITEVSPGRHREIVGRVFLVDRDGRRTMEQDYSTDFNSFHMTWRLEHFAPTSGAPGGP